MMKTDISQIEVGHVLYVIAWAIFGLSISVSLTRNNKKPTFRDWVTATIGISLEAIGIEVATGKSAIVFPLAICILYTLISRYLPEKEDELSWGIINGRVAYAIIFLLFFISQSIVLLFAFRGLLDISILYPGS